MKLLMTTVLLSALSLDALAELVQLEDQSLEAISAQSSGLTIDIDASTLAFTYAYQNDGNTNENFWVLGSNTGSGDDAVGAGIGSGDGLVKLNGITIDIGALPDDASIPAIAIGLPSTVELNRVNTGDYFIAHANPSDPDAPPIAVDPATDRKLIGLKWNTPPPLNFDPENAGLPARASDVVNNNFSNDLIRMEGQIYIFAN